MEKDLLDYEGVFVKLMKKGGAFTQNDIREIRSIPCDVLVEFFQTMQDKNHFRHKYFNSQMDFLAIMYESSVGLIAETRKIKKKQKQQKRKKFLREHPDLYMRDERWDFLGDIANATPEQMQLMWEEGLRLGINMPDTSSLEEPRHDGTPQLDEFFGEGAPNQLVEGSTSGNFEPRFSSTPLTAAQRFQTLGTNLDIISEECEIPPQPMAQSVDALHPDPIPQVDATPRLSQYLPNVSHPEGIRRTQGRVIEFNEPSSIPQPHTLSQELLQEVPKEPVQLIPPLNIPLESHAELLGAEALEQQQQPPVPEAAEVQLVPEAEQQGLNVEQQHQIVEQQHQIDEQQPDFVRLRNEAIQRHISTSASQQPPIRKRRVHRPLECWDLRDEAPQVVTEAMMRRFLRHTLHFPKPHIYTCENVPSDSSSNQPRQMSHQSSSSIQPNVSTSKEQVSLQLPSIGELPSELLEPQKDVSMIPEIPPVPDVPILPEVQPPVPILPDHEQLIPIVPDVQQSIPVMPDQEQPIPPMIAEIQQPLPNAPLQAQSAPQPMDIDQQPPSVRHIQQITPQTPKEIPIQPAIVEAIQPDVSAIQNLPEAAQIPPEQEKIIPREQIPVATVAMLTDSAFEKIKKVLRLLYARRVMSMMDLKDEFPEKIEMVGIFRLLLEFNGILWTMVSNDINELVALKIKK